MFAHLAVWSLLIILIEKGLFKLCSLRTNAKIEIVADDSDVINEAQRILQKKVHDTIQVKGFKKVYKTKG